MAACQLFFLVLAYSKLYNMHVWEEFFSNIPHTQYKVFLHSKLLLQLNSSQTFNITLISKFYSAYGKSSHAMNGLFEAGLNASYHERDAFLLISSDTIPIKPFSTIYDHYCLSDRPSKLCVAPTDQWFELSSGLFAVKTHNWIALNKSDALNAVRTQKKYPKFVDVFAPYTKNVNLIQNGYSWEELWFFTALYGPFNKSSPSSNLVYPFKSEQGICGLYAWWEDYLPESPFLSENIPKLTTYHTKGNQMLSLVPYNFLTALKQSKNFHFIRKIRDDEHHGHGVIMANGSTISMYNAILELNIYRSNTSLH